MSPSLTPAERECLRDIQRAAIALGIDVIAVGANARRLVFDEPNGISPYRVTNDWDFGVRVADWAQFERLREQLTGPQGRFVAGQHEHRLRHAAGAMTIDLVPFGGIENHSAIIWPGSNFEMNVIGFTDACDNATEIDLGEGLHLKIATVHLQIALKFFAFNDRSQETDRDLRDIWHVLQNYPVTGQEGRLYDDPLANLIDEAFDWAYSGPLLLGYDTGRFCNPATTRKLIPIVAPLVDPYSPSIQPLVQHAYSEEAEIKQRRHIAASFDWLSKGLAAAIAK